MSKNAAPSTRMISPSRQITLAKQIKALREQQRLVNAQLQDLAKHAKGNSTPQRSLT